MGVAGQEGELVAPGGEVGDEEAGMSEDVWGPGASIAYCLNCGILLEPAREGLSPAEVMANGAVCYCPNSDCVWVNRRIRVWLPALRAKWEDRVGGADD